MIPGPVQGKITVAAKPGADLRTGETVTVHVVKRLDLPAGGQALTAKWAVAIKGRVYPAVTELPLEPGAALRARVTIQQGKLVLSLTTVLPEDAPDAVAVALRTQGIAPGTDAEVIARALARAGLPLLPETLEKVRSLLSRAGVDARQGARAAASLLDKGFDLGGESARTLLPVLSFGQKGGGDHRRYRGRPSPETRDAVKAFTHTLAAAPSAPPSPLQTYNHARAGAQSWIVIPFIFGPAGAGEETRRTAGTLKILYDHFRKRPMAMSVVTESVAFHLPLQGRRALSIFCDPALRPAIARGLDTLRAKFHNMGLEVDDTINEGNAFDGFSPIEGGTTLPRIDMVG